MKTILLPLLALIILSQAYATAGVPIPGRLVTKAERLSYSYVGSLPIAPLVAPLQGEGALQRETTYRRIDYSGSFFSQTFYILQFNSVYAEVSGAKVHDAENGAITEYPSVQYFEVDGTGCEASKGDVSGPPVELNDSFHPAGYHPSRDQFDLGFEGDGICHEEWTPPSGGSAGSTRWFRDDLRIEYLEPDTQEAAMARGTLTFNDDNSSFHRKGSGNNSFTRQECSYSAEFIEACGLHRVRFVIKKQPLEGGVISEQINEVVIDLGKNQKTQQFELPIEDGFLTWVDPVVLAFPIDCQDCPSHGGEPGHGSGPQAGSVDWSIPLGTDSMGRSFGLLRLYAETLMPGLDSPESFAFLEGSAAIDVVESDLSNDRQFKTTTTVVELRAEPSGGASINFFRREDETGQDAEGFSLFSEAPYLVWQIVMPSTGSPDLLKLDIVKNYNGSQVSYQFTEDFAPVEGNRFQRFVAGNDLRIVEKTYLDVPGTPNQERVVTVVMDGADAVSSKTEEVFEQTTWGKFPVSVALDPDGVERVTSYDFESGYRGDIRRTTFSPDGLRTEVAPGIPGRSPFYRNVDVSTVSGGWSYLAVYQTAEGSPYGFNGSVSSENTLSRADSSSDMNIAKRTYRGRLEDHVEIDGSLFFDFEIQEARFMGEDYIDNGYLFDTVWDEPTNLKSYRREYASGPLTGMPVRHKRADGTVETWSYAEDPATGVSTVVHHDGAPDASDETVVTEGVRRTTETTAGGILLLDISEDIASGVVLERFEVLQRDASGRPTHIVHLDNSIETRSYSDCCGQLESSTRHGQTVSYGYDTLGRLESETRDGLTFMHDRDADGRLLRTTRHGTDGSAIVILEQTYNLAGELTSRAENGLAPTLYSTHYPGDGTTVRTTTLPDGGTIIETTNHDGSLASRSGTAVPATSWTYAASGDYWDEDDVVERITEYRSATEWVRTYRDMTGRILRREYPAAEGHTEAAESITGYNDLGQETFRADPDGVQTRFGYNDRGHRTVQALDLDRNAEIDYAGDDRIIRTATIYTHRDSIPVRRTTRSRWETSGSADATVISISETSLDGFQTWNTTHGITTHTLLEMNYDSLGARRETTTYADDTAFVRIYRDGRLSSERSLDANGQLLGQTDFIYDAHGRMIEKTVSGVGTTTYVWNIHDQLESVTTPDPEPTLTGIGLDPQTTGYAYDLAGRVKRVDHHDGTSTHTTYWPDGQVRRTWGSRQYPVEYSYTPEGRLETLTTWQDFSDPTTATVTEWDYDSYRGWRLSKEIAGSGEVEFWEYTPAGRLKERINGRGLTTTHTFNDAGDLQYIAYSDATPGVSRIFDRLGRVATTTDASGQREHRYQADRPTGERYLSGPLSGYSIDRSLDSLHRLDGIGISFEGTPRQKSTHTYNAVSGRLKSITANGVSHTYHYTPWTGLPDTRTVSTQDGTVLTVAQEWDAQGRLRQTATTAPGDHRAFSYRYNDANQRTRLTLADDRYWSYVYDTLGQLTGAAQFNDTDQPIPGRNFGFTFDDIGNRTETVTNGRTASYIPNERNQYVEREVPGAFDVSGLANTAALVTVDNVPATRLDAWFYGMVTADNSAAPIWRDVDIRGVLAGAGNAGTDAVAEDSGSFFLPQTPQIFIHDEDGNLIEDGRWLYTWDAANRLVQMETLASAYGAGAPRQRLTFGYDSQGRRFSKTVEEWDDGSNAYLQSSISYFLYDDWNLIAELTTDETGSYPITRSTFYTWGPDLSGSLQGATSTSSGPSAGGVGGLLAVKRKNSSTELPYFDGNGNVMGYYAADTGASVAQFEYDPFGDVISATGSRQAAFRFRFSTKYEDTETGFLYYGFRYYDPVTGRWPSRDPIEERGGLNLYGMVNNDLLNRIDYLGQGQLLSWSLFAHWLGGSGTPKKLKWSDFDNSGSAKSTMRNTWINANIDTLKNLCKNSPDGKSHVSGPVGSKATYRGFQNNATPFISAWDADAVNHDSGVTIDHDCKKKECSMEFGLNLEAYDTADFNPGDHFGPSISIPGPTTFPGQVTILPDGIPDDSMIWVRDNVPGVGADFRIYALSYTKTSHTVGY